MSKINKDVNKYFWISLIASVLFVVGIPMIVLFAGKIWPLMALGIVFVVFGFYGMPLLWIKYGELRRMRRVVDAINNEHLLSNKEISMQLQISERDAKAIVTKAINKQYITGFLYDGNLLTPNNKQAPKRIEQPSKCGNCGGKMQDLGDMWHCPYCGTDFTKKSA